MKRINLYVRRVSRLSFAALSLLFAQQAFAVGTPAGTIIENTASAQYSVGGIQQDAVDSNPVSFVVDRKIDFTLTAVDTTQILVTPGQSDAVTTFTLTNIGNANQDFLLEAINLTGDAVFSNADTDNVEAPPRVYADTDGTAGFSVGDAEFVDELSSVDGSNSITLFVVANVPSSVADGVIANVELRATAATGNSSGSEGVPEVEDSADADNPAAVQVVFADLDNDGVQAARSGYAVESAALNVTKTSTVIDDFISSANPKAIPGAVVEYEVTVSNNGSSDATNAGMVDTLDSDLSLALAQFGAAGDDAQVDQGGSTIVTCSLDNDDNDGDGCGLFGGDEVRIIPTSGVTLGGTTSGTDNEATFRFRATIN